MEFIKTTWTRKILVFACILFVLLFIIFENYCHFGGLSRQIPLDRLAPSKSSRLSQVSKTGDETAMKLKRNLYSVPQRTGNKTRIKLQRYEILRRQDLVSNRHLPKALIIGVKKGGTRALLEFLRLHPDVRAAGSEVHFFDHHYSKGFHWYRHRMPITENGQITMEKTPSYFVTAEAPKRVHHMDPATKLVVVVRDPVTRAISDYTQVKSKRPNMPRFEELAFVNGSQVVDTSWAPLKIGVYAKHLERWLKYFPLSQMLFVSGEKLISNPAVEVTRVQDFLDLKRLIGEKHFYFNVTKGFPCLKSAEGATPHCLGKNKGRSHPYIDPIAIKRLRDFYRPFNRRFYQLTNIEFGWH